MPASRYRYSSSADLNRERAEVVLLSHGGTESSRERRGELGPEEQLDSEAKLASGHSRCVCGERLLPKDQEQICTVEESRVSFARIQNHARDRDVPSARLVV